MCSTASRKFHGGEVAGSAPRDAAELTSPSSIMLKQVPSELNVENKSSNTAMAEAKLPVASLWMPR
jgi:hypothetical protein